MQFFVRKAYLLAHVFVWYTGEGAFLCLFKVDVEDCSLGAGPVLNAQVEYIGEILEGLWNRIVVETDQ